MSQTYLGVVLARGGSKRFPRKNMQEIAGVPLVKWAVLCGLTSDSLSSIIVSSDSDEILDVCAMDGVYRVKRPSDLSSDTATSYDALKHAYWASGYSYDNIVLLQPTSPLRHSEDVRVCCQAMEATYLPGVVTVDALRPSVPNGAVYVGATQWILEGGNWDLGPCIKVMMAHERSIDVDRKEDLDACRAYLKKTIAQGMSFL